MLGRFKLFPDIYWPFWFLESNTKKTLLVKTKKGKLTSRYEFCIKKEDWQKGVKIKELELRSISKIVLDSQIQEIVKASELVCD